MFTIRTKSIAAGPYRLSKILHYFHCIQIICSVLIFVLLLYTTTPTLPHDFLLRCRRTTGTGVLPQIAKAAKRFRNHNCVEELLLTGKSSDRYTPRSSQVQSSFTQSAYAPGYPSQSTPGAWQQYGQSNSNERNTYGPRNVPHDSQRGIGRGGSHSNVTSMPWSQPEGGRFGSSAYGYDNQGTMPSSSRPQQVIPAIVSPSVHYHYQTGSGTPNHSTPFLSRPNNLERNTSNHEASEIPRNVIRQLDSDYKLQPRSFFRVGRVFITPWSETAGENTPDDASYFTYGSLGQGVIQKVRRFIIVQQNPEATHCVCVPICTYGKRGATKPGLNQSAHAIVYEGAKPPKKEAGEENMTKDPIRIRASPGVTLHRRSRVNFGKPQSVELNCLVMNLGQVHEESQSIFQTYYENSR
ncbi:hypothetical protein L228DRAFT_158416 [Xylona heveae TC161]|uniref:DUF6590 domain-containing protein n=1 Tax=Xylona heveae (strain CBS 132557 / TC161) TaxID=1328760 RepID=A0A165G439_XYLHT|nr:hypothetical protein L228DRAFT_158416 [Xylona heveae TC161]KZF21715.1 hypothetical protein L228DRAFT_158416 [Xylona heveae TC161]